MRPTPRLSLVCCLLWAVASSSDAAQPQVRLRIMPPDRATLAVGQRFDLRVEATSESGPEATPPWGLVVTLDGVDVTPLNVLAPGADGERGVGGTGCTATAGRREIDVAPPSTSNFALQDLSFEVPGPHVVTARTADGATARVTFDVGEWQGRGKAAKSTPRARNVIFFLGDGMGAAHRTAARILSRGVSGGQANSLLAMDSMPVTGQVMTFALNSVITDSAPGMAAYVTGCKSNNNQEGVHPDNTPSAFDNPRIEYLGELLRRTRGPGFSVGIVTTGDLTDATPAANAVHTAQRGASDEIAARFHDERQANGVRVLMGGGSAHFLPEAAGGARQDGRNLLADWRSAGFAVARTTTELRALREAPPPAALLGLFHPGNMSVAFDKVGAGRYSTELARDEMAQLRDQPMLDDMLREALRVLVPHSPDGFYLLVEGASIDKAAHGADAERMAWDVIEMDAAVQVALDFAAGTNADRDPANDTLVIVTADHECGGLGLVGVGNERYAPQVLGRAVRDYAAVYRFDPEQTLNFFPNYVPDASGYPTHPDPSRKLLMAWAAGPDRYENWVSNRRRSSPASRPHASLESTASRPAQANALRDGGEAGSDNLTVDGQAIPGFLVTGVIENGENACEPSPDCAGDTSSLALTSAGHTASDVPLSAQGPGQFQFTGTYDNTAVFLKILRATAGTWK